LFIAFKLNSTPTNVAAYISVLDLPSLPQQSASLCLPNDRGMEVQHEGITHISRESPSHSWSETFPERSNSICGNQLSSTIEETGICPLRGGLKSGFDSLVVSVRFFFSSNLVVSLSLSGFPQLPSSRHLFRQPVCSPSPMAHVLFEIAQSSTDLGISSR
jgi:hypothetical protein